MIAREVMTADPVLCTPDTSLKDAAQMMAQLHVGAVPVVSSAQSKQLIGILTDRDITCRAVSQGMIPDTTTVSECMTPNPTTVLPETSVETCCRYMEAHQIRRLPVVNEKGECVGIIAQADIAEKASGRLTAEVLREVSHPTMEPRRSVVIAA